MQKVWKLTHDVYVKCGYIKPQPGGLLVHYPHLDQIPETTVIVCKDDEGNIVGTNSFTVDGPEGLHVESEFSDIVSLFRMTNLRLSSTWRIETDPECNNRLSVVKAVIIKTFEIAQDKADIVLATFHPRHEAFYTRLLNFIRIAQPRPHKHLNAHAILMATTKPWIEKSKLITR
jgi:hypothetical protein